MRDRGKGRNARAAGAACLVLLGLVLTAAGCASGASSSKKPGWTRTEVYLGSGMSGGGTVSSEQYADFLNTVVTKEFPLGVTVFDAYGQMQREDGGITRQGTKVVLLVHQDTSENAAAIARVVEEYRKRYDNPQVMKTTEAIEVDFYNN